MTNLYNYSGIGTSQQPYRKGYYSQNSYTPPANYDPYGQRTDPYVNTDYKYDPNTGRALMPGTKPPSELPSYTSAFTAGYDPYTGSPTTAAPERAAIGGQYRAGFANSPTIDSILAGLTNVSRGDILGGVPGALLPESFTNALSTKEGLGYDDFGIPFEIRQQMKTALGQSSRSAEEFQKESAKRLLASAGLLDDAALQKRTAEIGQAGRAERARAYSDIDIQSGLQATQQYLQNLNEIASLGLQGGQFQEAGRQFNIGALMDTARLDRATQQWAEAARMDRARLAEAIAQWLEGYDLDRIRIEKGIGDAKYAGLNDTIGTLGGFSSGLGSLGGIFAGGGGGSVGGSVGGSTGGALF